LPLSAKARVEVYLPDLPKPIYLELLNIFAEEFSSAFGGCTIIRGLDGNYLSKYGQIISDRINLIYTDTPFDFQANFSAISDYTDELRKAAFEALEEEAILVVAWQVYHSV
jgi:hypothetical protein